jgi:hypothetical protein
MQDKINFEDYDIWVKRSIIADCLTDVGMKELASHVVKPEKRLSPYMIGHYLTIIIRLADKQKNTDVLAYLYRNGFLQGASA